MPTLPETTLSSPILDAPYLPFLEVYSQVRKPKRTEIDKAASSLTSLPDAPSPTLVRRHQPNDTPSLSLLGENQIPPSIALAYLTEVAEVVSLQRDSIESTLGKMSEGDSPPLPSIPLETIVSSPVLLTNLRRTIFWLNVVDQIIISSKKEGWTRWQGGWFSRRVSLIPVEGTYLLCSTDVCLMMKDLLYSRFIIHLYCHLDTRRTHLSVKLDEYVAWGDPILRQMGNRGYEVLKGIESLTQTALIAREETILDGIGQHQTMLDKYTEKEIAAGGTGLHVERLSSYLDSFKSSRDLAEAFGFLKLWGHPYVDPYKGCQAVKSLAQQDLNLRFSSCLELEWSFCHLYCRGYLKRLGRWPRLSFVPRGELPPTRLQRLSESEHPSLAFGFTQYDASDWQWVSFDPHHVFDEGEDILSLVVDKSISHPRTHFDSTWAGRLDYNPPRSPTSTRVLEELISRPHFDLREVVDRVSRWDIPEEWKIVTVCPKEREMKPDPRMFSMMVLEMRLFFVLTEHNIAEGVFKNMPEQTMTLSRQELLDLFLNSTRPTPGSWVKAVLGIDFSKWNTMWRGEAIHPIGKRMDQMYGKTNVFSVVHRFFEESMCLLRLPEYPPDFLSKSNRTSPPESRSLWYGHKGGFEGIAQKLWTAATLALIHMALWHLGLSYKIIGQGDNQVCIVDIYVPPDLSEEDIRSHVRNIVDKAAQSIAETGIKVGQIVKPEECIYSTCFLTYGKEMILRGAYLPTSLKYISRLFPSTTSDAPSVYEMISSISSGASGATERNDWSYPTYFLAKFMEGITLKRELTRSLFHGYKLRDEVFSLIGKEDPRLNPRPLLPEMMSLLLSIPSNLGGLPITTVPEIMYRGHADPLCSSLLHLHMLATIPVVANYFRVLTKGWLFSSDPDVGSLIQDPYSLPIVGTSIPSSSVSSATSSLLPVITHNKQFSEILERSTPADKESLVMWLKEMRPFYPKVAHDLYKSSMIGVRDAFSRRFSNTRTILSIGRKAKLDISGVSLSADFAFLKQVFQHAHLAWKVEGTSFFPALRDHFWFATTLRRTWFGGEELEGITTAHPLSVGRLRWLPYSLPLPSHPSRISVMGFTTPSFEGLDTRGPVSPYLGSSTSLKSVAKWVRPIDSSPPLRDVFKILSIRAMMAVSGSEFWDSVTRLAQSRSAIDVEAIDKLSPHRTGGTTAHRYLTRDDAKGSFWNSCFNWPSHLTFSTNQAGEVGAKDYPFSFQEAMICMSTLTSWGLSQLNIPAPWGLCLDIDPLLMTEVSDHIVSSPLYEHPPPPSSSNYYASVLQVTLSSNAHTAARLAGEGIHLPWEIQPSSPVSAAAVVFLQTFRSNRPTTTKFGHTVGIPQSQRVIDLPEVGRLTTHATLAALTQALWMKIGLAGTFLCTKRTRPPHRTLRSLLDLEVRRGIPSLAGTLREIEGGNPLFGLGIGLGREGEADALARWMTCSFDKALSSPPKPPFLLFEMGTSSSSSLIAAYLGITSFVECLSEDRERFKNGKLLARLVKRALSEVDEQSRVRLLALIVRAGGLSHLFRVDSSSPVEALRQLRLGDSLTGNPSHGRVRRVYIPPAPGIGLIGGSARLVMPWKPLPSSVLVESWFSRPLDAPAAAERWAPLSSLYNRDQRVLLLGVGQGDIGGALPVTWTVTGVELASSLQSLGHSFPTFQPPGLAGRFSLHPVSWTTTGDVFTSEVKETLVLELKKGLYDLVLIDVEGVDNHTRLALRWELAQTGVPAYCKVLAREEDGLLLIRSWGAYAGKEDHLWTTLSYPGREFIVGRSRAPLGVYACVPDPLSLDPTVPHPDRTSTDISGYPDYNPGPDLLCLTGHILPHNRDQVTGRQLRSLFPYITEHRRPILPWFSIEDLAHHLTEVECPRRRIRALIRLDRHGLLDSDCSAQLHRVR